MRMSRDDETRPRSATETAPARGTGGEVREDEGAVSPTDRPTVAGDPLPADVPPEVLVLAPQFPSLNQPWIDTYLEQLHRQGLSFAVATSVDPARRSHDKVDRLGLRQRAVRVATTRSEKVGSAAAMAATSPYEAWRMIDASRKIATSGGRLRSRLVLALRALHLASRLRRVGRPQVIHSHSLTFGYGFLAVALRWKTPLVLSFHGLEPSGVPQVPRERRHAQFEQASRVIVNTKVAGQQAVELGCAPAKVTVLPQGLPIEEFPFAPRPVPGQDEPLRLLTVGRLHPDKGHRYALDAARRLTEAGREISWDFVGFGPEYDDLVAEVGRLNLDGTVRFLGTLESQELRQLYRQAHMFVLASVDHASPEEHVETQGVVLQEAQASGCIPVATRVGGIPECVTHDEDGLLVPDRSGRAIAEAVEQLLSRPERWPTMQRAGRENVERRFSADAVGEQMAQLLREEMGDA